MKSLSEGQIEKTPTYLKPLFPQKPVDDFMFNWISPKLEIR